MIAEIRVDRSTMKWNRKIGVSVTVKDRRGYLIRGASLRLTGTPARYLTTGAARVGFTNRLGQVKFAYRLHTAAFAKCACKQLVVTARASTPRATTMKRAAARIPVPARR